MYKKDDPTVAYQRGTLFPVALQNGQVTYYFCDFKELLGYGSSGDVYKGYSCSFISPQETLESPRRINASELEIDFGKPVAFKIYKNSNTPSTHQVNKDHIALVDLQGRLVQIMSFIDGFHIYPKMQDNPELSKFSFLQAVDLAWQLVLELDQLHTQKPHRPGMVHGDITGFNLKVHKVSDTKTNVYFLDYDYVKPISKTNQIAQGTPEFTALEVLRGIYTAETDFYALTPILYSIFGAFNPLQNITKYRNTHPQMSDKKLITAYSRIGYCTTGLFAHFEPKPELVVLDLLKQFLNAMGSKELKDRPTADSVLEFFTALRQWCLLKHQEPEQQDTEQLTTYLLKLHISCHSTQWVENIHLFDIFIALSESEQTRLIQQMSVAQKAVLYTKLLSLPVLDALKSSIKSDIVDTLVEQSQRVKNPSLIGSLFFNAISSQDLVWLAHCFSQDDYNSYFSRPKPVTLESIQQIQALDIRIVAMSAHKSLSHIQTLDREIHPILL